MRASERVVITIPMNAIWREDGTPVVERVSCLTGFEIAEFLRSRSIVRFVVADVGKPLLWVPLGTSFDFWKSEAKHNIHNPTTKMFLDAFPGSYCFAASLWKDDSADETIILLEKHH